MNPSVTLPYLLKWACCFFVGHIIVNYDIRCQRCSREVR